MNASRLENRSGYHTGDLARFFGRGLRAMRIRNPKRILVVSSPSGTHGCAEVSRDKCGGKIVIAIAPPSRLSIGKLARIFMHECAHAHGLEHADMKDERLLYSEGKTPPWACGTVLRYVRRAPDQMPRLRARS